MSNSKNIKKLFKEVHQYGSENMGEGEDFLSKGFFNYNEQEMLLTYDYLGHEIKVFLHLQLSFHSDYKSELGMLDTARWLIRSYINDKPSRLTIDLNRDNADCIPSQIISFMREDIATTLRALRNHEQIAASRLRLALSSLIPQVSLKQAKTRL